MYQVKEILEKHLKADLSILCKEETTRLQEMIK